MFLNRFVYSINVLVAFLPSLQPSQRASKLYVYIFSLCTTLLFVIAIIYSLNHSSPSNIPTFLALSYLSVIVMYISLMVTYYYVHLKHGNHIVKLLIKLHQNNNQRRFQTEVIISLTLTATYCICDGIQRNTIDLFATIRNLFIIANVFISLHIHAMGVQFRMAFKAINIDLLQIDVHSKRKPIYRSYVNLCGMVNLFNDAFGWQILFICATFVLCVLHAINLMIVVLTERQLADISVAFWVSFITYLLTTFVLCIPFASSCNGAGEEAKSTALIIHTLIANGRCVDHGMVRELQRLTGVQWPRISAAGFFDVDHTMLFTLFGSVTSYLIVLIQLKDMRF